METRLAERLGREAVLRCRVTHAGIVIELAAGTRHGGHRGARDIGADACAAAGRAFAGVRPYARGAAFLRKAVDG